jgi:hypothetical protein
MKVVVIKDRPQFPGLHLECVIDAIDARQLEVVVEVVDQFEYRSCVRGDEDDPSALYYWMADNWAHKFSFKEQTNAFVPQLTPPEIKGVVHTLRNLKEADFSHFRSCNAVMCQRGTTQIFEKQAWMPEGRIFTAVVLEDAKVRMGEKTFNASAGTAITLRSGTCVFGVDVPVLLFYQIVNCFELRQQETKYDRRGTFRETRVIPALKIMRTAVVKKPKKRKK